MEKLICSMCAGKIDPEEDEYVKLYGGTIICQPCYDETTECTMCGGNTPEDDPEFGCDAGICFACMEEKCPTFHQRERGNEAEIQAAYEVLCAKYTGKRVPGHKAETVYLDYTTEDEAPITYSFSVTLDEKGYITYISLLFAEKLINEWERGYNRRPYPIHKEDYTLIAEDLIDDAFFQRSRCRS